MAISQSPFFILGNPRSGTTVLRLMLDSNPRITVPPECGFLVWFYKKYNREYFSTEKDVNRFIIDLKTAKKIESWKLDFVKLERVLAKELPLSYGELVDLIYRFYSNNDKEGQHIWGDKNNFYIHHIQELATVFPQAKFIHIVRDGRDVACSYKELNNKKIKSEFAPKLPESIDEIAIEWQLNNQKIIEQVKSYSSSRFYHLVKYENLIHNPKAELDKIMEFLEVNYDPNMLLYYQNSKSYEPMEYLQWKAKTTKPLTSQSIGRFKKDLTQEEIAKFNNCAKKSLQQFNYEL